MGCTSGRSHLRRASWRGPRGPSYRAPWGPRRAACWCLRWARARPPRRRRSRPRPPTGRPAPAAGATRGPSRRRGARGEGWRPRGGRGGGGLGHRKPWRGNRGMRRGRGEREGFGWGFGVENRKVAFYCEQKIYRTASRGGAGGHGTALMCPKRHGLQLAATHSSLPLSVFFPSIHSARRRAQPLPSLPPPPHAGEPAPPLLFLPPSPTPAVLRRRSHHILSSIGIGSSTRRTPLRQCCIFFWLPSFLSTGTCRALAIGWFTIASTTYIHIASSKVSDGVCFKM